MSMIETHINTLIASIKAQAIVASKAITVERHGGRFTWDELARKSHGVPVVFLSVLGFSNLDADQAARYSFIAGSKLYRVRVSAGIVTRSNRSSEDRNAEGQYIAEQLCALLDDNDFNLPTMAVPENISAEGLFVPQAEKNAMSLWLIRFELIMGAGAGSAIESYDDFLLATGENRTADNELLAETRIELTGFN